MPDTPLQSIEAFDNLEVIKTGVVPVSKPVSTQAANGTVTHSLGYTPICIAFVEFSSTSRAPVPYVQAQLATGILDILCTMAITDTDLQFSIVTVTASSFYASQLDYSFRYYLLRQRAK